ncbi:MAG TPA: hypothetical protein VJN18_25390 [Polyangiaceae bacterium]|nr:hypothetical protein [Polyangiaceae bacterium]
MKQFCLAIALAGVLGGCSGVEVPSGNGPGVGGSAGAAGSATQGGAGSGGGGVSGGGVAGSATLAGMGGVLGGTAGMSGGGGVGGVGGDGPDTSMKPSTGCTKPPNQALDEYVRYTLTSSQVEREYFVRLPANYDPAKPYRLMITHPYGNGRGDSGTTPLYNAENAEAIFVGPSPNGKFFKYTADSADVKFFDEMLAVVEGSFCVDQNRIFASGMSSGSWFTNVLGCQRSNVLRAQGNISGCWPDDGRLDPNICNPRNIAGLFIHDEDDGTNSIECGMVARDRLLAHNGCSTETMPIEPAPCVEYQGCKPGYPVVWCQTQGKGHDPQNGFAVPTLYNFFAQF